MTEQERTVQVPASLIADVRAYRDALTEKQRARFDLFVRLPALLSQSEPSAEPQALDHLVRDTDSGNIVWVSPQPPPIEDMAPGTTFVEEVPWAVTGRLSTGAVVAHSRWGEMKFADRFDPSTIRDVTPPAASN